MISGLLVASGGMLLVLVLALAVLALAVVHLALVTSRDRAVAGTDGRAAADGGTGSTCAARSGWSAAYPGCSP